MNRNVTFSLIVDQATDEMRSIIKRIESKFFQLYPETSPEERVLFEFTCDGVDSSFQTFATRCKEISSSQKDIFVPFFSDTTGPKRDRNEDDGGEYVYTNTSGACPKKRLTKQIVRVPEYNPQDGESLKIFVSSLNEMNYADAAEASPWWKQNFGADLDILKATVCDEKAIVTFDKMIFNCCDDMKSKEFDVVTGMESRRRICRICSKRKHCRGSVSFYVKKSEKMPDEWNSVCDHCAQLSIHLKNFFHFLRSLKSEKDISEQHFHKLYKLFGKLMNKAK